MSDEFGALERCTRLLSFLLKRTLVNVRMADKSLRLGEVLGVDQFGLVKIRIDGVGEIKVDPIDVVPLREGT